MRIAMPDNGDKNKDTKKNKMPDRPMREAITPTRAAPPNHKTKTHNACNKNIKLS